MKIGVVGCGYWGPNLLRNLVANEACDTVVACDQDVSRLKNVKKRLPSLELCASADELFEDETVDGVMIATPVTTHYPLAKRALQAGKHVFVEKPFTSTSAHAEELIATAKRGGRALMVGHTFLYSPPVQKIKEIIDSGELGDIYYISSTRVNLGLHQKDISVIWDLAPHDLSMLFHWLGERPISVTATGKDFVQPNISDVAFVNMVFPSNAIANVTVSWLSPSKLRQTTIVGSKKMLIYDDTAYQERVKIFDQGVDYKDPSNFGEYHLSYRTGDIVSPKIGTTEPLATEVSTFIRCIETGESPLSDGQNGLDVVSALEAAEKAMVTQKEVKLAARSSDVPVTIKN